VIRKLPSFWQLPNGYGCVAIKDVNDVETLSERLAAIVEDPGTAAEIGKRGRDFACGVQSDMSFPQRLEHILQHAAARQRLPSAARRPAEEARSSGRSLRFPLTWRVAAAMPEISDRPQHARLISAEGVADSTADLIWARQVLDAIESCTIGDGNSVRRLAKAIRIEIAVAAAEEEADQAVLGEDFDPLFRLKLKGWAMSDDSLPDLLPAAHPHLRIVEFDFDVAEFSTSEAVRELPAFAAQGRSYIAAFGCSNGTRPDPLLIDELTARILRLSDGTRTVAEVVDSLGEDVTPQTAGDNLYWVRHLFLRGLLSLRESVP
jgi:hypothetical protein